MKRQIILALTVVTLLVLWGCGSPSTRRDAGTSTGTSTTGTSNVIHISPTSAVAGSADVTLTITGSGFAGAPHDFSQAVWSSGGNQTNLATTFVSSTQLTAVVPADLLIVPASAQVFVLTGDPMGDSPPAKSGSAGFTVTALPVGTNAISSISPESAPAGGSDTVLTITGRNFDNQHIHSSVVFWSTTPNDPDCCNTWLATTFVSSTELTAVIPADLLRSPVTAHVFVETGDPQGMSDGVSYPRSNTVAFTVGP